MDLSLPSDLQQRINAQVTSGGFASPEDVLREAIGALERRQRGLAAMREIVAAGEDDLAAGRVGLLDGDAIKREVRDRLAERGSRE